MSDREPVYQPPENERLLTLDEAWSVKLRVGDVIQGLTTTGDYDTVEVLAAEHFRAELRDTNFFAHSLGVALRPSKFQGELRNGVAVVVPTDLATLNRSRSSQGNSPHRN